MAKTRIYLLGAALAAVVVLAAGFFLGVQPQLAAASASDSERSSIETTNAQYRKELDRLAERARSLPSMKATLARLQKSIPASAETPQFLDQLNATSTATGVTISAMTIGDPTSYQPPATAVAPTESTPTDTASASPSASPSAEATSAPSVEPSTPAAPAPATSPLVTSANFAVIPVSVDVKGTYDQALAFTKGVQSGGRLFLVDAISSTPAGSDDDGTTSGQQTWTLGGSIYVLTTASEG